MIAVGQLEYLERALGGGWLLRFTINLYFEEIKDEIKRLPRVDRYWNSKALGGRGAWWVSDEGLAQIARLFTNYQQMRERADRGQHRTQEEEQQRYHSYRSYHSYGSYGSAGSSTSSSREKAFAALYLLPTAPAEVAQAVYRALAKMYHPDYGGDLEKMKQINTAYDVVKASYPTTGGR